MKRKKPRAKGPHPDAAWTEWGECTVLGDADGNEFPVPQGFAYYKNNHYTVVVSQCERHAIFGNVLWLSIKRNDRRPIHDFRDLQRIKNTLVGPEYEAMEIYPAESRLVDTSNQMHLWVFLDYKIPYGYAERLVIDHTVSDTSYTRNAKQRPFRGHEKPADCLTSDELDERLKQDMSFASRLVHRRVLTTWRRP